MKFKTILADPPWEYETRTIAGRDKSPDRHYDVMHPCEIALLPVEEIADDNCVLLMWITWPHLIPWGQRVIEGWGFEYRTGYPWLKLSRSMIPRMGTGFHARQCTEPLLIGTRGKPPAPEPFERQEGVLFSKIGRHSAKPEVIYERAELYDGPYLEIFARPYGELLPFDRPNWTQIGNEITGRDIREDLLLLAERPTPCPDK
jgi:N6-adenosine-specific RNA methylase IME4